MNEAVMFIVLGLSFFEVSFLLLYNIENSFLILFFPKLFFEKVKKRNNFKLKTIYFICYLFIILKSILGWSFTIIMVKLFFNGIDFLTDIIPKDYNNFSSSSILALILVCAELSRSSILDIDVHTVFKKCCRILKKWNIFLEIRKKKKIENKNI